MSCNIKDTHYLLHVETCVIIKCDISIFINGLSQRLVKWVMLLFEIDLKFVTHKEIKGQVVIDQLVKAPSLISFPNLDLFLDQNLFTLDHDPI